MDTGSEGLYTDEEEFLGQGERAGVTEAYGHAKEIVSGHDNKDYMDEDDNAKGAKEDEEEDLPDATTILIRKLKNDKKDLKIKLNISYDHNAALQKKYDDLLASNQAKPAARKQPPQKVHAAKVEAKVGGIKLDPIRMMTPQQVIEAAQHKGYKITSELLGDLLRVGSVESKKAKYHIMKEIKTGMVPMVDDSKRSAHTPRKSSTKETASYAVGAPDPKSVSGSSRSSNKKRKLAQSQVEKAFEERTKSGQFYKSDDETEEDSNQE